MLSGRLGLRSRATDDAQLNAMGFSAPMERKATFGSPFWLRGLVVGCRHEGRLESVWVHRLQSGGLSLLLFRGSCSFLRFVVQYERNAVLESCIPFIFDHGSSCLLSNIDAGSAFLQFKALLGKEMLQASCRRRPHLIHAWPRNQKPCGMDLIRGRPWPIVRCWWREGVARWRGRAVARWWRDGVARRSAASKKPTLGVGFLQIGWLSAAGLHRKR